MSDHGSRDRDLPGQRQAASVAARRRRLHRALGAGLILAFTALLIWGRCHLSDERERTASQEGAAALVRALDGDASAWDVAEDAYRDLARTSIWDPYGLFALELVGQLRAGEVRFAGAGVAEAVEAIRLGRLAEAAAKAAAIPDETARVWVARLVADLRAQQTGSARSLDP